MNSQIYKLALLSKIDDELDERKEEFGDLPEKLKNIKIKFEEAKKRLEESEQILSDNKKFAANAKVKLKALKEKEDKLSKQQFLVRKNVEFDYEEAKEEFNTITNDQDEDVKRLVKRRKDTLKKINKEFIKEYNRIRDHTHDAAVRIKRNSCSGCFSSIPPQKIVEIRNDLEMIFTCENCGRILYPEDIVIGDDEIFG